MGGFRRLNNALRRAGVAAGCLLFAAAVNLALFWALAALNRGGPSPRRAEPERPVRYVIDRSRPTQQRKQQRRSDRSEPMRVETMATSPPKPQPVRVEPRAMEVALEAPATEVSPVAVSVAEPVEPVTEADASAAPAAESSASSGSSGGGALSGSSGARKATAVDHPPRGLSVPPPEYPSGPRRRQREGAVTVRLVIDERGRVAEAELVEVDGPEAFGRAVLTAVEQWRFEPARHGGRPVRVIGYKTINFELRG